MVLPFSYRYHLHSLPVLLRSLSIYCLMIYKFQINFKCSGLVTVKALDLRLSVRLPWVLPHLTTLEKLFIRQAKQCNLVLVTVDRCPTAGKAADVALAMSLRGFKA